MLLSVRDRPQILWNSFRRLSARLSLLHTLLDVPGISIWRKRQKQEVNEFRITVLPCVSWILRERGYPGDAVGEAAPRRGSPTCAKRNFQCRIFLSRHVDSRVSQVSRSQHFFVVFCERDRRFGKKKRVQSGGIETANRTGIR